MKLKQLFRIKNCPECGCSIISFLDLWFHELDNECIYSDGLIVEKMEDEINITVQRALQQRIIKHLGKPEDHDLFIK
jgi:hypothetical protein